MYNGDMLISMGFKPSKLFKEALELANTNDWSIDQLRDFMVQNTEVEITLKTTPSKYHFNIHAETPDELNNLASVKLNMDYLMYLPTVVGGAVMPDACPTQDMQIPVGGVVVTKNAIHPSMHSADICCSVMLTNFGFVDPKLVLNTAHQITHFGAGGRSELFNLPNELMGKIENNTFLNNNRTIRLAKTHMGTQGDGNHFLYVGKLKSTGETVMVTHHGSRGFGAQLFKFGMKSAERFRSTYAKKIPKLNAWLPFDTQDGQNYWEALQIVREWTKLNHKVLHDSVAEILSIKIVNNFWNEHNFVFKENDLFYHAKGATPLSDKFVPDSVDGLRLVPLNMAQPILIVKGDVTDNNLGFAPHGAGRNVSRSKHIKNNSHRAIDDILAEEISGLDIRFFSGKIDISELPSAYKDANNVRNQIEKFGLGEVVDLVEPYGCIMAGHQDGYSKRKGAR